MPLKPEELQKRFKQHHPISTGVAIKHDAVRAQILICANALNEIVTGSRESSLVFTKLEEAMMWANADIARNQND